MAERARVLPAGTGAEQVEPAVAVVHTGLFDQRVVVLERTSAGVELAEACVAESAAHFPGGRVWTTLVGESAEGVRAQMAAEVNRVARELLDLDTSALRPAQARALLSECLAVAGEQVLWVVDGVTSALPELVLPTPAVRPVLIGLCDSVPWPVSRIAVPDSEEATAALVRVRECSEHAQLVLGFASLLAPAPFEADLAVEGVAEVLGEAAPELAVRAFDELHQKELLHRTGDRWRLATAVAVSSPSVTT